MSRVEEFKNLKEGWNFGKGSPFNEESFQFGEKFLQLYGNRLPETRAIFMSTHGNIEITFRDDQNSTITVEFVNGKIEYYVEKLDCEGTCSLEEFEKIISKL